MPLDALTADWSLARNRPIQAKHVDALYTIFERGDMKRASYPLAVLSTCSEVQCMLLEMGYDTTDTDDMPSFDKWLPVNGRPVELLDGQHRVAALERLVSNTGVGKQELYWPCNFYDRDSHGDIRVQLLATASKEPDIFHGNVTEMEEQMLRSLRLGGEVSFPLHRLATIWRNERWRQMTTRLCEAMVGRATFQISTWDWMICHGIDYVFLVHGISAGLGHARRAARRCREARLVRGLEVDERSLGAEPTQDEALPLLRLASSPPHHQPPANHLKIPPPTSPCSPTGCGSDLSGCQGSWRPISPKVDATILDQEAAEDRRLGAESKQIWRNRQVHSCVENNQATAVT
ncbi:hypothetical protein PCL_10514 [Purpureocillium lilacinum]|uniref:Uncharacterized protein n=1 Tax=Purpureocillium lilacinum TaxID=33203 RepID=A0A2U3DQ55_PURLI|nr:hypothetical protein PCL_10514 [Purpureocillium lilacinum]